MFNNAHIPHPFRIDTNNIPDVQSTTRIGATNTGKHHMRKSAFRRKTRKQDRQICRKFKESNAKHHGKSTISGQLDDFAQTNIILNKGPAFRERSEKFHV